MSTQQSAGRVRSTYAFIKAHRERYSVQSMCRVLGVAPSGYYDREALQRQRVGVRTPIVSRVSRMNNVFSIHS